MYAEKLTLRDQFAMAALGKLSLKVNLDGQTNFDWVADACYKVADAMLHKRGKDEPTSTC